ncbi:tetratricopeptide repeat protein [Aquabacterium humicola]|uniref:tetratricopeptide repeat protein n=1 Tax=Aquabacterium humicola TaxID=3237377 RepID=UPI0025437C55|nr:tetratricopeptide repeat protein [Rubrivivax pictus]
MSYVVQVWAQPEDVTLPGSLDATVALVDYLQQRRPSPVSAGMHFATLAEQLRQRYPVTPDQPGVWSDALRVPPAGHAVWPIGLARSDRLDEVQLTVVARALALGLNVLDEQAAEAHLSDGRVYAIGARGACVKGLAARLDGDHATAVAEFRHLAAEGNREAMYALAECYLHGQGLRQNTVVGCALLCAATGWHAGPLGVVHAPREARDAAIGRRVREQVGPGATAAADQLLRRFDSHAGALLAAIDACCREVDAHFDDADHALRCGDHAAARRLLGPLADHGHEIAQHLLAGLIAEGRGAAPDAALAARWTQRAAKGGHAPAQLALARLYEDSDVLEQDLLQAERWYRSAAAAGEPEAAEALDRMLGRTLPPGSDAQAHFVRGQAAEAAGDFSAAARHHTHAARHGHAGARNALGALHRRGDGVPRDWPQAALWFELAAEQGITEAQYALACMHRDGQGVPRNEMKAWQWFGHAANQFHAEALAALGAMAADGAAAERDLVAAKALSLLAQRRGAASRIALRFAPGEQIEVQALVDALVEAPSVTGALASRRRRQRDAQPQRPASPPIGDRVAPIRRWHPARVALLATAVGLPAALLMKAGLLTWLLLAGLGGYGLQGTRALRRAQHQRRDRPVAPPADSVPG